MGQLAMETMKTTWTLKKDGGARERAVGKGLIQKPIPSEDEELDRDSTLSWQREAGATCKVMSSPGVLTLLWLIQPPGNWRTAPHAYTLSPLGHKGFSTSLCNDKAGIPLHPRPKPPFLTPLFVLTERNG